MKLRARRIIGFLVLAVLVLFVVLGAAALLLQRNPPVAAEPPWDSPQTRVLAQRACFDCHSNLTNWPWFTRLPPGSMLAVFDTVRGRRELNFSEWSSRQARKARESAEQIQKGEMPPPVYLLMHPEARLSETEKAQLIAGLQTSLR